MTDDLLIAYSVACAFFGRVLRPGLDIDLLRRCAQERMFESWPLPGPEDGDPPGLALVAAALTGLDDERLVMIEDDNTTLFIGPEAPVPMWESVWTTEDRLLFESCTSEVQHAFAEFGFEIPDPVREPSDHLAYELAFVAALLARAADHIRSGEADPARRHVEAAAQFIDRHLVRWAPACLAEVAERARSDFYRGIALLCADTLAQLSERLDSTRASN
jgi:TorA maturation chaperone TorD